jgi:hypothetical protein
MRGKKQESPGNTQNAKSLVTFGGGVVGGSGRKQSKRGIFSTGRTNTTTCTSTREWERLHDADSGQGIRADYEYAVELEPVKRTLNE